MLLQRLIVFRLETQSHPLVIRLPSYSNLNLKGESTQLEHVPHVSGHCSFTPSRLHLEVVALLATQEQSLAIFLPSLTILKRNGESSHESAVTGLGVDTTTGEGAVGGVCEGGVGVVGSVGVPVVYKST